MGTGLFGDAFIGRAKELSTFARLSAEYILPHRYMLIQGPVGSGKSRLLREFSVIATRMGMSVFSMDFTSASKDEVILRLAKQTLSYATNSNKASTNTDPFLAAMIDDLPLFSSIAETRENTATSDVFLRRLRAIATGINGRARETKTALIIDAGYLTVREMRRVGEGLFGELTEGTLIVVASRHRPPVPISERNGLVTEVELEPFTSEEISSVLQRAGLNGSKLAPEVLAATQGSPFLVIEAIADCSGDRFDSGRFLPIMRGLILTKSLAEISDLRARELLRLAAIFRRFNPEMLGDLSKVTDYRAELDRVRESSLVHETSPWIRVIEPIRECLLDEWRLNYPKRWITLNKRALGYYSDFIAMGGDTHQKEANLEKIYHLLCTDEKDGVAEAMRQFRQAESRLDVMLCRQITNELRSHAFRVTSLQQWSELCEAVVCRLRYEWEKSQAGLEAVLKSAESAALRAHATESLARTLQEFGDWKSAETASRRATDAFAQLDKQGQPTAHILLGTLLTSQHRWDEALGSFNTALAQNSKVADPFIDYRVHLGLADLFRSQGQWDSAHLHLERALSMAEALGDKALQANARHSFGKLYRQRQEWNLALFHYERSVTLRREIGDRLGEAQSLHSLGTVLLRLGRLADAKSRFEDSLAIKASIRDQFGCAKAHNSLGHIDRLSGDVDAALSHYETSLQLFRSVRNETKVGRVMCRIGMTFASQGRTSEAMKMFEQSRDVRLRTSDRQGVAETLYELGLLQESLEDIPTAEESFLLSLKFANDSRSRTRQLAPLVHLAILAYREKRSETGTEFIKQARKVAEESKLSGLLAGLYLESARNEVTQRRISTSFLAFAESAYSAAHERDEMTVVTLVETVRALEAIRASQGAEVAEDAARRMFVFWGRHCPTPAIKTRFWTEVEIVAEQIALGVTFGFGDRMKKILMDVETSLAKSGGHQ